MRYIGDEIAPHGFQFLEPGDIVDDNKNAYRKKKAKKYYGIYIKLGGKDKKVQRFMSRAGL